MKLPIKKEYFDQIKTGKKQFEFRDAHITFVCEETGEQVTKRVCAVALSRKTKLPQPLRSLDLFSDDDIIVFGLSQYE